MTVMAKHDVADGLNERVAACMRTFGINAREAINQVVYSSTAGLRLVDRLSNGDTEIWLCLHEESSRHVNAHLSSPRGNAADITDPDPDAFLKVGIGFDVQEISWGWKSDNRPDYIDAEGREWY